MRFFALPVLSALVLTGSGCKPINNLLLVENNSGMVCSSITVSVCDSSWTIENMSHGEQQEFTIVYTEDDSFHVSAQFADSNIIEGSFGYVTHGLTGERIRISINDTSIDFRQSGSSY